MDYKPFKTSDGETPAMGPADVASKANAEGEDWALEASEQSVMHPPVLPSPAVTAVPKPFRIK